MFYFNNTWLLADKSIINSIFHCRSHDVHPVAKYWYMVENVGVSQAIQGLNTERPRLKFGVLEKVIWT